MSRKPHAERQSRSGRPLRDDSELVKITIRFSMSYPALATRLALRSHIIASSGQRHRHEVRSPKPSTTRDYMSRPAQASRSAWGFCAAHPLRAFGGDGGLLCL